MINPIRISESGMRKIERIDNISQVIRIGGFLGRDEAFFKAQYDATLYALKGYVYTQKSCRQSTPKRLYAGWCLIDMEDELPLSNASLIWLISAKQAEAILKLDQNDGILITADSLQNTPHPYEYHNFPARIMMKSMGYFHPYPSSPAG